MRERYQSDDAGYITSKLNSITPANIAVWLVRRSNWTGSLVDVIKEYVQVTEFDLDDKRIYLAEGVQEVIAPPPKWIDMVDDALGYPKYTTQKVVLIALIDYMDKHS